MVIILQFSILRLKVAQSTLIHASDLLYFLAIVTLHVLAQQTSCQLFNPPLKIQLFFFNYCVSAEDCVVSFIVGVMDL